MIDSSRRMTGGEASREKGLDGGGKRVQTYEGDDERVGDDD